MTRAYISDQGHDRVILRTPYNPRFTAELQEILPRRSREWSRAGKRWFIARECLPRIIALAQRHFDDVQINRPLGGTHE